MSQASPEITLELIRQKFYVAVVCDVLDQLGYRMQSPRVPLVAQTIETLLVGRCKTTLWVDMAHEDPDPYVLELAAVDSCRRDDVIIGAAAGSMRSGIWGELLTTAARNRGAVGAIVDGAVRDVEPMRAMDFPCYARGRSPYDSCHRQRVVDIDVPVSIGDVLFHPGDLVLADADGVVVIPQDVEADALRGAWEKIHAENRTRDAIRGGMKAGEAYRTFGVL